MTQEDAINHKSDDSLLRKFIIQSTFPGTSLSSAQDRPQGGLAAKFVREESGGRSATICENMNTEPGQPRPARPVTQLTLGRSQLSLTALEIQHLTCDAVLVMSNEKEEDLKDAEQYEDGLQSLGNGSHFKMYYALGPEMDQPSILETSPKEDIALEDEHSETESESDSSQKKNTIPPDNVTSAKKIQIITEEPRKVSCSANVSFNNRDEPAMLEDTRDYTSMQRQMDAYQNLEDLLDVPWEESDLAPPSKVDVVLRVGGELGERYNNV